MHCFLYQFGQNLEVEMLPGVFWSIYIRNVKLVIVNASHFTHFWNQGALITFPESLYQTRNWPCVS